MSGFSSEFRTVQVLFGLGNLSALQNTGVPHFRGFDCTKTYINTFGTKRSVSNIVDGHFSGVPVRQVPLYILNETESGKNTVVTGCVNIPNCDFHRNTKQLYIHYQTMVAISTESVPDKPLSGVMPPTTISSL